MSKKQVVLGKSDIKAFPIGLGTNAVGGHNLFPNTDDENGREIVRTAINNGINLMDTAFIYGPKRSEELIGEVIKEYKREEVIICTKAAHILSSNGNVDISNSPDFLKKSVKEALTRLQTDYIDLFYIHMPDEDTPKYEAVGALKELKDEGIIRAIGVSNFDINQLQEANQDHYVDVMQGEYNLLNRKAEKEILPYAEQHNISFIPYFPLGAGLLAGKYNKNSKFDDFRKNMPNFQSPLFEEHLDKVEEIRKLANDKGEEISDIVLAYYLSKPAIDVVIPGAKKKSQVTRNVRAAQIKLSDNEIKKIEDVFSSSLEK